MGDQKRDFRTASENLIDLFTRCLCTEQLQCRDRVGQFSAGIRHAAIAAISHDHVLGQISWRIWRRRVGACPAIRPIGRFGHGRGVIDDRRVIGRRRDERLEQACRVGTARNAGGCDALGVPGQVDTI